MLSVVIINFKNAPLLRLCLKSLSRVLNFEKEIIVVDVASTLATRSVAQEEFPEVKLVIFKDNIGFTRGVNEGIKRSGGDYVFVMNPDIIPLNNSLQELIRFMDSNPETGMVGSGLLSFDGSRQSSCFRFYTPLTIL